MTEQPILVVEGLEKNFGGVVAAQNISMQVNPCEQIAIIGSNGAGKTTFVNMVTGYLKPSAGSILFHGKNITGMNPRQTALAGIRRSFQIAQVFPQLTALENMIIADAAAESAVSLWASSLRKKRINEALEMLLHFGLEDIAMEQAGTLPQGTRKKLDIAMASVGSPSIMLLDEPTSGVSVDEKMVMMEKIIEPLKNINATIMFIEHDVDIVRAFAHRVIAFYEGTILADGDTESVLANEKVRDYVIGRSHA